MSRLTRFQNAVIRLSQNPAAAWSNVQRPSPWSALTTSPVTNPRAIYGAGGWSNAIRNSVIGSNVNARKDLLGTAGSNIGAALGGAIGGPAGAMFGRWAGGQMGMSAAAGQSNWQVSTDKPHSGAAYGGADTADPTYGKTVIQMTRGTGWGGPRNSGPNISNINQNIRNWNPPSGPNPLPPGTPVVMPPGGNGAPPFVPPTPPNIDVINQNLGNWSTPHTPDTPDTPLMDRAAQAGGDPPQSLVDGTGATGEAARPLFDPAAQKSVDDASSYYTPPSGGMGALSSQFNR